MIIPGYITKRTFAPGHKGGSVFTPKSRVVTAAPSTNNVTTNSGAALVKTNSGASQVTTGA